MQEAIRRALDSVIDPELRKPITELGMVGDIESAANRFLHYLLFFAAGLVGVAALAGLAALSLRSSSIKRSEFSRS